METHGRIASVFLVITACLLTKVLCQEPSLTILPRSPILTIPASTRYALQCQGNSDDDDGEDAFTEMRWLNQLGDTIPELDENSGLKGVKSLGPNGLKLNFPVAAPEDSGNYTCTASYRNTKKLEASVSITFYVDMEFGDCNEKQNLVLGRPGKITCEVSGDPAPTIGWEKDSVKLRSSERITIHRDGFTISEVQEEDKGRYKIEAYVPNTGKDQVREIEVEVHIPPVIRELEKEFMAIEGEEYAIECHADGFPRPRYTWYDRESRNLSEVEGFLVNPDEGTLTIKKVERRTGGSYRCFVQNQAGNSERAVELIVLVKPTIREFNNKTSQVDISTTLVCKADGNPEPRIEIRKESSHIPITENQENRIELQQMREGETMILNLKINHVQREDAGVYYCSASNEAGKVDRGGHLEVQYPPNMHDTVSEVMTWAGNPANLSCIADANPNATITWKYQDEIIESTDKRYVIYGGTTYSNLLVRVSDIPSQGDVFGKYECHARNPLGENSVEIDLKLATTPGPLFQVLFDRVTSTTITFKFLGPGNDGGLPVQGYHVTYWPKDKSESEALTKEWSKDSPYILSNLKPRVEYIFKVAARNAVGVGEHVRKTYEMPPEAAPEIPSFTIEDETVSDDPYSFKLRWTIPEDNGQPIQYFEIRYFKVDREINTWKQLTKAVIIKIENWANPEYELTNLSPSTWYRVELRAHNQLGNSFPGHLVFKTTAGGTDVGPMHKQKSGPLSIPIIIAIAVAAVLILLILLDVTCYLRFHCGLLYLMRYHTCGRSPSAKKVRDDGFEDGKACVKEVSTANNGKIKTEIKIPSPKAVSPIQNNTDKAFNHTEKKRENGDNPAFENNTRPADLIIDESFKNKSPKGSKSSIGKSSPV